MGHIQKEYDKLLIDKLQKGDIEAFDRLFEKYGNRIYSFAHRYLQSKSAAEDLVQDVFVKIWENRKGLKKDTSFRSYLFTIAYNDICKFFRKQNYLNEYIKEINPNDSSNKMEESTEYASVLEQVNRIIDLLPPRIRSVFIKSRLEGMSSKEIAKELNIAPGTVDNYVSEALNFVRKHLNEENISLMLFFLLFLK